MKTKFYWHLHHDVLCEPLVEPLKNRIDFIKKNKPKDEIETRLRLMKPVKGKLPEKFVKAREECAKAGEEFDKAGKEFSKAGKEFSKARKEYVKAREECAKAGEEFDKAGKEFSKARKEYFKAREECKDEIEAVHRRECPNCPWDGNTIIFPKAKA